jgi:hypothetical protein
VAALDTASVTEDGTLVAAGNVLTHDVDGNGLALTVISLNVVNGIAASGRQPWSARWHVRDPAEWPVRQARVSIYVPSRKEKRPVRECS